MQVIILLHINKKRDQNTPVLQELTYILVKEDELLAIKVILCYASIFYVSCMHII